MDTRYRVSVGAVYSLKYHLVWCPKYRLKVLVGPVEKRLRQLLYQKAKELEAKSQRLELFLITFTCSLSPTRDWLPRILPPSSKDSRLTNFEKNFRGSNRACLRSGAAAIT